MRATLGTSSFLLLASVCASIFGAAPAPAPKLSARETAFFENKIRPVLAQNCYKCHSTDAVKIKGGLRLDSRDAVRQGDAKLAQHVLGLMLVDVHETPPLAEMTLTAPLLGD